MKVTRINTTIVLDEEERDMLISIGEFVFEIM